MKKILFFVPLFVFACGGISGEGPEDAPDAASTKTVVFGPDETHRDVFVPGQEGRIDGSVWQDGLFNSPEAKEEFCSSYAGDDAWFCVDAGASADTEKATWRSVEFHGLDAIGGRLAGTCFGDKQFNAGHDDCIFPESKKTKFQWFGCTSASAAAVLGGATAGMTKWNNIGGATVSFGTASTGEMQINVDCNLTTPGTLAEGGLSGTITTRVTNAAAGPFSGHNLDDFRTINGGIMHLNVSVMREGCKTSCGGGSECTSDQLKTYAKQVGAHEMGHVLGFGHFFLEGNLMYPFRPVPCDPPIEVHPKFGIALLNYMPATSSPSEILNLNLQSVTPD